MTNGDSNHLELSKKADRDLRKMPKTVRAQLARTLKRFGLGQANVDVKQIAERPPYLRLRSGNYRVLLRPLTEGERQHVVLRRGSLSGPNAYVVARVVDRAELDRAIQALNCCELED